jgi:hypothetical protein
MAPDAVLATLRHVWTTLQSLNVPIAMLGGVAMSAWKRPRFTRDVDLLLAVGESRAKEVLHLLNGVGVRSMKPDPVVRIETTRFMQLFYTPQDSLVEVRVDLLFATTAFHESALAPRVVLPASELGFEVTVVSCEDLIILKLIAWRILDRVDISELLKANRATIDFGYLGEWTRKLSLRKPLREAWQDAFPGEPLPA